MRTLSHINVNRSRGNLQPARYSDKFIFPEMEDISNPHHVTLSFTGAEFVSIGPAGTGKTEAMVMKVHKNACLYSNSRGAFVRKTKESVKDTIIPTYYHVLGYNPMFPGGYVQGFGGTRPDFFRYPNGSEIRVLGMMNPKDFDSTQWDQIYVNQAEDLLESEWEILTARCRGENMPYNPVMGCVNPSYPESWLNPDNPDRRKGVDYVLTSHIHNPRYFRDGEFTDAGKRYMKRLQRLKGLRYKRYYEGKWVAAEGVVFEGYDFEKHISKKQWRKGDFGSGWEWYCSIDFGATHPKVSQLWAVKERKEYRLVQEIYKTKLPATDFYFHIFKLIESWTKAVNWTTADHDGEANLILEDMEKTHQKGLKLRKAKKRDRLLPRIELQKEYYEFDKIIYNKNTLFHEPDEFLLEDNKPTSTPQEIPRYAYPENRTGTLRDEYPVDGDDHGIDAQGYFLDEENGYEAYKPLSDMTTADWTF